MKNFKMTILGAVLGVSLVYGIAWLGGLEIKRSPAFSFTTLIALTVGCGTCLGFGAYSGELN